MFHITPFTLLEAWALVTGILVLLLIYRTRLTSHEKDQIFLDPAERSLVKEQHDLVKRLHRLSRPIVAFSIVSISLLVAMIGLWLWQGLNL